MSRQTIEVVLPESNDKIIMYSKFTHGDLLAIRDALLKNVSVDMSNATAPTVGDLSGNVAIAVKRVSTKLLINKVITSDGDEVTNLDDYLYNLSIYDGEFLAERVEEIDRVSQLGPEDKKKSPEQPLKLSN